MTLGPGLAMVIVLRHCSTFFVSGTAEQMYQKPIHASHLTKDIGGKKKKGRKGREWLDRQSHHIIS